MLETRGPDPTQECMDCRTVLSSEAGVCCACGGRRLLARGRPRFPYDALAAFLGVIVVILFWAVRG